MDNCERKKIVAEKIYNSWIPGYSELGENFKDSICVEIIDLIVEEAFGYWERANCAYDFCMQCASLGIVVFGGTNRLTWSYQHGFKIDKSYCSPNFLDSNKQYG